MYEDVGERIIKAGEAKSKREIHSRGNSSKRQRPSRETKSHFPSSQNLPGKSMPLNSLTAERRSYLPRRCPFQPDISDSTMIILQQQAAHILSRDALSSQTSPYLRRDTMRLNNTTGEGGAHLQLRCAFQSAISISPIRHHAPGYSDSRRWLTSSAEMLFPVSHLDISDKIPCAWILRQ